MTLKVFPFEATPPTVTITFPVVAPVGTCTVIDVALQLDAAPAEVLLKVTVLAPCESLKPVPVIVTVVPAVPAVGEIAFITGAVVGKPTTFVRTAKLVDRVPTEPVAVNVSVSEVPGVAVLGACN